MDTALIPNCIETPLRERENSLESAWLSYSDFGESLLQITDSESYPCLTPVYNGKTLNIRSELVHASLSGISIKHYYGKCYQEEEKEMRQLFYEGQTEGYGYNLFEYDEEKSTVSEEKTRTTAESEVSYLESETVDQGEAYTDKGEPKQPICLQPKINFRNSFWNLHQPELCKLTWGQQYVSAATVTEHLHNHLLSHGPLCMAFHEAEDRELLLNKELDEYVRLKELAAPRVLPPDEDLFNFKADEKLLRLLENPRCKNVTKTDPRTIIDYKDRFLNISDDEDPEGSKIHRSKEEFCLTIGKHVRKPPMVMPITLPDRPLTIPQMYGAEEEEDTGMFFYNWFLYQEESFGEPSDHTVSEEETDLTADPCPPLGLDEFCRAAGKADFSDLRCNPDDF